jgi:hypothetical protein
MQPLYTNLANEYELKGNALAQCMERTTVFGWRCYSWVLLVLLTALVGVSVALGVVANEPKSKCFGKQIRSVGPYDPTKQCLTVSSEGVTAMPDGTCPNECDQELYESHTTSSERRLTESSAANRSNFCINVCENYYTLVTESTQKSQCTETCTSNGNCVISTSTADDIGCAFRQAYSSCNNPLTYSSCESMYVNPFSFFMSTTSGDTFVSFCLGFSTSLSYDIQKLFNAISSSTSSCAMNPGCPTPPSSSSATGASTKH